MSTFSIVFIDGKVMTVDAVCFSVAKVKAAHKRVLLGDNKHTQLIVDDKKSSRSTKALRGWF